MSREYQPGDVAMVDGSVMLRTREGWLFAALNGGSWSHAEGSSADRVTSLARPLVVIDPEDREQVERLRSLLFGNSAHAHGINEMQAALREFADPTPPKPDEPTGLGAVVEDEAGDRWVRITLGAARRWQRVGWPDKRARFAAIDAVRVLSDGVQS